MLVVELEDDDFDKCKGFVKIGRVARAIARAKGASNLLDAERKIFPRINAGVQFKALNPINSETMAPLPRNDYGLGIVSFKELAEWGRSTKLFEFEVAREELENFNSIDEPPVSQPQDSAIEVSEEEAPGKLPKNSVGKLAVKAAWEIECKKNRRATDVEVMDRLQQWADKGDEPDILKKSDRGNRRVFWMTKGYKEKGYTLEACQRTLKVWSKSRE